MLPTGKRVVEEIATVSFNNKTSAIDVVSVTT
jgi:hypothetical protein